MIQFVGVLPTPPTGTETINIPPLYYGIVSRNNSHPYGDGNVKELSDSILHRKQLTPPTGTETKHIIIFRLYGTRNNSHPYGDGNLLKKLSLGSSAGNNSHPYGDGTQAQKRLPHKAAA